MDDQWSDDVLSRNHRHWDARDMENGLRERTAKIVASKISGHHPDSVTPDENDYAVADKIGALIEKGIG